MHVRFWPKLESRGSVDGQCVEQGLCPLEMNPVEPVEAFGEPRDQARQRPESLTVR